MVTVQFWFIFLNIKKHKKHTELFFKVHFALEAKSAGALELKAHFYQHWISLSNIIS